MMYEKMTFARIKQLARALGYKIRSEAYASEWTSENYKLKIGYNAGVYGWNCDVYCDHANEEIVVSGYRYPKTLFA